jgi:hypothetical protein
MDSGMNRPKNEEPHPKPPAISADSPFWPNPSSSTTWSPASKTTWENRLTTGKQLGFCLSAAPLLEAFAARKSKREAGASPSTKHAQTSLDPAMTRWEIAATVHVGNQ